MINNLLTLNVWSYVKISNLSLAVWTLLLLSQYGKVSVEIFPVKTSLLVNKYRGFSRSWQPAKTAA